MQFSCILIMDRVGAEVCCESNFFVPTLLIESALLITLTYGATVRALINLFAGLPLATTVFTDMVISD